MKIAFIERQVKPMLIIFNSVWAIGLILLIFILPSAEPPFKEIRAKIAASQTIEDLRPRTEHAINALEYQQKTFTEIRKFINRLLVYGAILSVANIFALYYLTRKSREQ